MKRKMKVYQTGTILYVVRYRRNLQPNQAKLAPLMSSNAADAEVFIYTGPGGASIPRDVVRVRVDPSVTSIPVRAFHQRKKLAEVELCEGLVEIGEYSFGWCTIQ
jgi:hypothetical protein